MRRSALAILGFLFVVELTLFAILPIVPLYVDSLGLSKLQAGAVLSAAPFAVVIASIPFGMVSDRIGSRRVTLAAAVITVGSSLLQAFAGSFEAVLLARLLFGLGSAVAWTSALSWLSDVSTEESRASTVGATVTAAGAGSLVGPALAGFTAQHFSVETAFLVIAGLTAVATVGLMLVEEGIPHAIDATSLRTMAAVVVHSRLILGALLMMFVAGFVDGVVNLLAPLELSADGLSSGPIGLVFSVAAAIFIGVSAAVSRRGGWASSPRAAGAACLIQAVTLVPVLISVAAAPVIFMVLARGPASAVVYTVAMPVAIIAARRHGVGTATVAGVVGTFWGFASMIGSPIAGLIADATGDAAAYGLSAVLLAVAGVWLLRAVPQPTAEPDPVGYAVVSTGE
jgi:predicted MFS family arabinose efflux permease